MNLQSGQPAPQFELRDQDSKTHKLSDYLGKWVVLYFYPEDFTSGCIAEACSMRDSLPNFKNIQAEVLGISKDSVESHKKFSEKYQLAFTLLADVDKKVINAYGVSGGFNGGALRTSFLINPQGEIAKIYENVKLEEHAAEVLGDLQELNR